MILVSERLYWKKQFHWYLQYSLQCHFFPPPPAASKVTGLGFVLLLSTLVCCQPKRLIWAFYFPKFSNFTPPPLLQALTSELRLVQSQSEALVKRTSAPQGKLTGLHLFVPLFSMFFSTLPMFIVHHLTPTHPQSSSSKTTDSDTLLTTLPKCAKGLGCWLSQNSQSIRGFGQINTYCLFLIAIYQ